MCHIRKLYEFKGEQSAVVTLATSMLAVILLNASVLKRLFVAGMLRFACSYYLFLHAVFCFVERFYESRISVWGENSFICEARFGSCRKMDQNEEVVQTSGSKTLLVRHLPEELSQDEKEDLLKYFGAQSVRVFSNRGRMVSNDAP